VSENLLVFTIESGGQVEIEVGIVRKNVRLTMKLWTEWMVARGEGVVVNAAEGENVNGFCLEWKKGEI
jgi:hypothetical protein